MNPPGKWQSLLLAAALTALVTLPIAIAGASESGAGASAAATVKVKKANERIKALNKKVRALEASLDQRLAALEKGVGSVKPSGPAGGDLTGTYPNPLIAPNAVGSTEIAAGAVGSSEIGLGVVGLEELANNAVTAAKIVDDTITSSDIAASAVTTSEIQIGSVRASDLGTMQAVFGEGVVVQDGEFGTATATCPLGTRLLSGGFEWKDPSTRTSIVSSKPIFFGNPETTWEVVGGVDLDIQNSFERTLFAHAFCLRE